MNPRLSQLLGLILVVVSGAMTYLVYRSTVDVGGTLELMITSGIIAWAILALPELAIGFWLLIRGSRAAKVGDLAEKLIPIVQREGRIGVDALARELAVSPTDTMDAAEKLTRRRLPLVYLDRRANEIVSPAAVSLEESLLHLLHAQRRMTFDQISSVTNATDNQIVEALEKLSQDGKFRGTIDKNSRVAFTSEAVEQLPKALTACKNCGARLPFPILPGEEEYCPYCGHFNVNRLEK
jgi:DNA-binding Lrp family transcriptional regulator